MSKKEEGSRGLDPELMREIDLDKKEFLELYKRDPKDYDLFNSKVEAGAPINGERYHKVVHTLVNKVVKGHSPIIVIAGEEGKGKSMTALKLAHILHHKINLMHGSWTKENLVYDVDEFLYRMLNSWRQFLVFDEAGENVSNENWSSMFNKAVRGIIRTQRVRNCAYCFVLPKLKEFDSWIRERINIRLVCKKKGVVECTVFTYDFGSRSGGTEAQSRYFLNRWFPDMPPQELVEEYQEKEGGFKMEYPLHLLKKVVDKKLEEEGDPDVVKF